MIAAFARLVDNEDVKLYPRNHLGQLLPPVEVDAKQPPGIIRDAGDPSREVFLDWAGAIDDQGHIRKCPVCECTEFFVRKNLPQVTAFVLVLIAAAIAVAFYAADNLLAALLVLGTVVIVDLLIFFFAGRNVICYQCRTEFSQIPIAKNQQPWQAHVGERYRQASAARPAGSPARGGYAAMGEADFPTPITEAQGASSQPGPDKNDNAL